MKAAEELKMLKGWKEFFENLTVEWLVENNDRLENLEHSEHNRRRVTVYCYQFEVTWDGTVYTFRSPDHLGSDDLLSIEADISLFRYVPVDVMKDFVRVIEL